MDRSRRRGVDRAPRAVFGGHVGGARARRAIERARFVGRDRGDAIEEGRGETAARAMGACRPRDGWMRSIVAVDADDDD